MNSDLCLSHSGQITSLLWVSSVYLWNGTHNSCLAQGEKDQCVWSCLLNCTVWCILEGHLGLLWYHTVLLLCSHSSLCALLESFCTQSPIILSVPGGDKVTWLNDKWASLGLHPLLYLFLPLNSSYILFIISLYIIHKSQHSDMNTWSMLHKYWIGVKIYIYCYLAAWKKINWGHVGKHSLVQCQALGEQKISAL